MIMIIRVQDTQREAERISQSVAPQKTVSRRIVCEVCCDTVQYAESVTIWRN